MSNLAPRIADLSPEKRELLLRRLNRQRAGDCPQIRPQRNESNTYPLSYAQQRLWLLDRLEPGTSVYNIPAALRLTGPLDTAALERSLEEIVRRHAVLRTTFVALDGQPLQVIAPHMTAPLAMIDLRALPESAREAEAQRLIGDAARQPFDLARGPLLRAALVCLGAEEHVLLLTMHHIVSDGWSLSVFVRELAALYAAFATGRPAALPELPIQYVDFAIWQREWLQGAVLEAQLAYWNQQLTGTPPVLDLPTDRPRPPVRIFRGARQVRVLPQPVSAALHTLCREEQVTLFMALLAAYKLLLHRYTGHDDIVIGAPIAGRTRPEIESLIGFFLNTLVLRTDLSGNPTFRELLARVRKVCLDAYAHQDVPFEKLLEELQPARDPSYTPLFQVFFNMLNLPDSRFALPDLTLQVLATPELEAKFDLTLYVQETGAGIQFDLVYNADLFGEARMEQLLEQLHHLLTQIVAHPEQQLAQFSLVSPAVAARLPNPAQPLDSTWEGAVPTALARWAQRSPERLAVADPYVAWTYAELDARSNQLAHYLVAHGIQLEDVVAIYGHRSAALVWALLGVLKAGAAFLILDPAYPSVRLIDYLNKARPRAWIQLAAAGALPSMLEEVVAATVGPCRLTLPQPANANARGRLADYPIDDPAVTPGPDDLACIAFTSGSTGKPKGILGRHGPLTHFLPWQTQTFDLRESDRFSMLSGLSHDPLQRDIFTPIWLGATLCIPDPEVIGSPGRLAKWMQQQHISVAHLTPALGQLLTETPPECPIELTALRYAFIVGDILTKQDVARIRTLAPAVTCVNFYGSTETQRAVGYYIVPSDESPACDHGPTQERDKAILPLGRGMKDVQLLVLNAARQLAGIGEAGEIYVRSPHLARGYLGDEALTQTRFSINPFTTIPGDRLYCTGDLGRYRPDGNVEFVGRADQQVKIRGFRVEPGEIEALLGQHPAVREAVVIVREDLSRDKCLVAYVVPEEPRTKNQEPHEHDRDGSRFSVLGSGELRTFLKQHVPDYMVPAAFVLLDALPLTPNSKVDRRALPAPGPARPELEGAFVAPQTPVEAALADIWADVLGLEQVGVHDNFFALGGHSLLAAQLIARLRDTFAVDLPLRALFETPTVADLAIVIVQGRDKQTEPAIPLIPLPTITPAPDQCQHPFPLTDIQQAYWIGRSGAFELGNVATHSYLELDAVGLDLDRFQHAWQRLIERHDMLRAIVLPDGQQQILERVPPYQIELLDLHGQAAPAMEAQLEAVRQRMSHQVLPSDQWPLFELCAARRDDERIRLHISLDLLIGDAWSWRILLKELLQLYQDPAALLAPLELSFRDYVLAEVALRDSARYRRAQDYWSSRLATLPPAPDLPLAKNPAALTRPRFVRRTARLAPEIWRRLKSRTSRAGMTSSGILLAAFAEVLTVWGKSPRFTINLTLFNRLPLHPQVNDIVGDFTSLTLLTVDNTAPDTFEARARRLQKQLWEDLDHRYVSGVQVLRELTRTQGSDSWVAMPVVFTSTLTLRTAGQDVVALSRLGDVVYSVSQTPQVWLDHQVFEQDGALVFNWDAVEELFPDGLVQDMFEAYCRLLQRLADDQASWQATSGQLLPRAQLEQRADINATAAPIPTGLLHTLFAAQVPLRPDQLAVVAGDRTLTYAEVYRRANQVGHRLRRLGARPDQLVAVVMEKGWEQVVAVLGILQSGAAYLPIDPGLPKERIWYMLEHGEITLALTQSWVNQHMDWPASVQRLCVDNEELAGEDDRPLDSVQSAEDLAYVIYTSGSTGLPKGVMIDHRGAVNTIIDINQRFGVGPQDRVLALSSLSFDLSVYDIFGTLAAGGTIVFPAAGANRDPRPWVELLVRERVTIWNSVPALMQMLVEYAAGRPEGLPRSLRLVMLSGDWIPITLPGQIKTLLDGVEVISLGGATEASIWSILYPIAAVDPSWKSIPYGKPMVNQQFHVLNEALEPCPIWVPGQLYIGGIGLAKGYWRDEEKTRARFIQHPRMGERLYRTGDLGRYLPDGTIEFLGREDFQVKIQGYRIELGEIEAALAQHPVVHTAVAAVVGEPHGAKRLVAYVVPNQERAKVIQAPQHLMAGPLSNGNAHAHARHMSVAPDGTHGMGSMVSGQLNPLELLEFKLRQPGLRQNLARPAIELIRPEPDEGLALAYAQRRSHRTYLQHPLTLEQFSAFLSCLLQIDLDGFPLPKYRYPSAGNLYPVQTYVYIKPGGVEGLVGGTYYYHPKDHCLVSLAPEARIDRSIHAPVNQAIYDGSAFSLFLVGQLNAIEPMYGESARDFCMLEAGAMSQLLMEQAPAHQIGLCPIGKLDFEPVRDLFVLEESHVLLHSLLGGRIDPTVAPQHEGAYSIAPAATPSQSLHTDSAFVADLRRFLQGKLPEYMLPSAFVLLEALPLSSNGKVDRKALPAPDGPRREPAIGQLAPQTELERMIAAIWQAVLHVETVSLHDNFFDLGGSSVHMVQIQSKLREELNRDIPIIELFNNPTISSLAKYVSQAQSDISSFQAIDDRVKKQQAALGRQKQLMKARSEIHE